MQKEADRICQSYSLGDKTIIQQIWYLFQRNILPPFSSLKRQINRWEGRQVNIRQGNTFLQMVVSTNKTYSDTTYKTAISVLTTTTTSILCHTKMWLLISLLQFHITLISFHHSLTNQQRCTNWQICTVLVTNEVYVLWFEALKFKQWLKIIKGKNKCMKLCMWQVYCCHTVHDQLIQISLALCCF